MIEDKMTEIIIKGKFVIEGLKGFDNVRFPLSYLKLKVFPIQPYMVEAFSSYEEKKELELADSLNKSISKLNQKKGR